MAFFCQLPGVALRKESVDRNPGAGRGKSAGTVALRKESVDRNDVVYPWAGMRRWSLSARRAWIEMSA